MKEETAVWGKLSPDEKSNRYSGVSSLFFDIFERETGIMDSPEARLLITVCIKAAKDRDIEFLKSKNCKAMMAVLQISHNFFLSICIRIIDYYDNGVGFIDLEFLRRQNL